MKDKTTKTAKILALTEKGGSVKDIAKAVKCDDAYVYYVRWMNKNKKKKPSKIVGAVKQMKQALDSIEKKPDLVNHPPHYTDGGVDTLTYIEAKDLNYRLGNVVKYVSRCGKKLNSDPLQDLMKARFYLQREIDIRREA